MALINRGAFDSATGGTFQSDTDSTFHSDIPGTFESDMGGTFKVLQSHNSKGCHIASLYYLFFFNFFVPTPCSICFTKSYSWVDGI